jgi:hypothetical protein
LKDSSFPPEDQSPELKARFLVNGSHFGRIVRGLHPFNLHEGPQRLAALENLAAGPFGFGHPTLAAHFQ